VHLGLGHDNSFSPLFLAAPAPGTTGITGPPALPGASPQERLPGGMAPARAVTPARGQRRPTQPNAQNTSLVNP
jgi:hypothetical protein